MQWTVQLVSQILIRWIVIYPVDSGIQRLNNWGLESMSGTQAVYLEMLLSLSKGEELFNGM